MTRASRIASIEAHPITFELTEPFAIAKGAPAEARNVIVTVTLDDGTTGLGEAAPFTAVSGETQEQSRQAVEASRDVLLGEDARAHRRLAARLAELLPRDPAARCALEMALFDAVARQCGIPLAAHFGGAGAEVRTDLTITAGDATHARCSAERAWERGIHTLKVKVGGLLPEEDAERMRAVHHAAPRARLLADANGGYTVSEAQRFLAELERMEVPLDLFEQPVEPHDLVRFAKATSRGLVAICADESARSAADVIALIRSEAVQAVNLKAMKTGVAELIAMWHVARAASLRLMMGGMVESVLAMSFSAHVAAGLGGFTDIDLDTPMFIKAHPFVGGFYQTGDRLDVTHVTAGHGVTWPRL